MKKNPLINFSHTLIVIQEELGRGDLKLWNPDLALEWKLGREELDFERMGRIKPLKISYNHLE